MLAVATWEGLQRQKHEAEAAGADFHQRHQQEIDDYRDAIDGALRLGLQRLEAAVAELGQGNAFCRDLAGQTANYVEWMRWSLGDLPYFAFAISPSEEQIEQNLPGCALVYFAGRVLDDFLDRHHLYRGRRFTLLSALADQRGLGGEADALTVLMAVLLTVEGLVQVQEGGAAGEKLAAQVLRSARGLLIGILMDRSGPELWSLEFYERLIEHKNVDYWRLLYDALDPAHRSPLYPVLARYYALAQKLNDLEDYSRDELQGRPNIVSIHRLVAGVADNGAETTGEVLHSIETTLADEMLQLGRQARSLPEPARAIALLKIGEMQGACERIGFFVQPAEIAKTNGSKTERSAAKLGLAWHSGLEEFVQRRGVEALERVACPACGGDRPQVVFRKQGFGFNRCAECTHLYVSPRLRSEYSAQLAVESAETAYDPFLETQKIYAESICRTLSQYSTGQRLLDLGHGAGYLMLMARAYGFQVYGVDASAVSSDALKPVFGDRLQQMHVDEQTLPWGNFDQAVMSHVLEHMAKPRQTLPKVHAALNSGGLLYVAVPDSESLQFRVFGKKWDAVSPIAHPQFFNQESLSRLLRDTGFEPLLRVHSPKLLGPERKRWMRLFRRLGGDESGELAILARRVPDPPPA